jgi:small nuclear ribonucleoprotein (snRNP)-like protein
MEWALIIIANRHEQKFSTNTLNQYPLHLLKLAEGSNIMVELKSGETYNGIIKGVDKFTNIRM